MLLPCLCAVYLPRWWRHFQPVWRHGAAREAEAGLLHFGANHGRKRLGAVCSGHPKLSPKTTLCLQMRRLQTIMKTCNVYSPPFAEEAAQAQEGCHFWLPRKGLQKLWPLHTCSNHLDQAADSLTEANKRIYLLPSILALYKRSSTGFPYSSDDTDGKYLHKSFQAQSLLSAVPLIQHFCSI